MDSKGTKAILGALGTITGRVADLYMNAHTAGSAWTAVIDKEDQDRHVERLAKPGPGIELTENDIGIIIHGANYATPDTLDDFGSNFKPWVEKNKEMLAKINGWEGILKTYGLEPTVQYGIGAPIQTRTSEQYRADCKA